MILINAVLNSSIFVSYKAAFAPLCYSFRLFPRLTNCRSWELQLYAFPTDASGPKAQTIMHLSLLLQYIPDLITICLQPFLFAHANSPEQRSINCFFKLALPAFNSYVVMIMSIYIQKMKSTAWTSYRSDLMALCPGLGCDKLSLCF